jgi:hypothetical protein
MGYEHRITPAILCHHSLVFGPPQGEFFEQEFCMLPQTTSAFALHSPNKTAINGHRIKSFVAACLTLFFACLLPQAVHAERMRLHHTEPDIYQVYPDEEGEAAIKAWGERISAAFQWNDFKTLESWCTDFTTHQTRIRDGKWAIDLMAAGFNQQFTGMTSRYNLWENHYKKLQKWEASYPNSACAPVIEAQYWETYAWHARGSGYSDSVTKEGWALFKERLEKAFDVLDKSSALATRNPAWFTQMMNVAKELNWPRDKMLALTYRANDLFPTYFQASLSMALALTPEWGGSWDELHAFVHHMVKRTQAKLGTSMYTRIYWYIILRERLDFQPFKKIVDWNMMSSGFRVLRKEQPDSDWIINNYAAFACRANDKHTYHELRKQIHDDKFDLDAWPSNYSIDVCDRRMSAPDSESGETKGSGNAI